MIIIINGYTLIYFEPLYSEGIETVKYRNISYFLLFALPLFFLSSCSFILIAPCVRFDYDTFSANKAIWEEHNLQNYRFDYYSSGFYLDHFRVYVVGGEYSTSEPLSESISEEYPMTINDIFTDIDDFYLENRGKVQLFTDSYIKRITVFYDPDYGFPAEVQYQVKAAPGIAVDGNSNYRLENFTITD
jgi:hypothetical protein